MAEPLDTVAGPVLHTEIAIKLEHSCIRSVFIVDFASPSPVDEKPNFNTVLRAFRVYRRDFRADGSVLQKRNNAAE
ncbi:MAG: hypothetical protein R3C28_12640 [Pirellulaceae bacterium]